MYAFRVQSIPLTTMRCPGNPRRPNRFSLIQPRIYIHPPSDASCKSQGVQRVDGHPEFRSIALLPSYTDFVGTKRKRVRFVRVDKKEPSVRRRDRVPSVIAEGFRLGLDVITLVEALSSAALQ